MSPAARDRWLFIGLGGGLVLLGLAVILGPLFTTLGRGRSDDQALSQWKSGGSNAVIGALPKAVKGGAPTTRACGSTEPTSDAYALVSFPSLGQYGYAGVAGDGDWNGLLKQSMVHWHGSPAPGEQGNVIIAFHREPGYEHIDQLNVGMTVTVQDRGCHMFTYRIQSRADLPPDKVTELVPTAGHDLTLITCTPFYRDDRRLVWRAALV